MKITTQHLIIPLAKVTMLGDLLSLQLHRTKFVTHQGHLYMSQYRKQHLPYQAKLQTFLLDPKFNIITKRKSYRKLLVLVVVVALEVVNRIEI